MKNYSFGAVIPMIREALKHAGMDGVRIQLHIDDDFKYLMIEDILQINWADDDYKWELYVWNETMGTYYDPPDVYETLITEDSISRVIMAMIEYFHGIQKENAYMYLSWAESQLDAPGVPYE